MPPVLPFRLRVLVSITELLQQVSRSDGTYYTWDLAPDADFEDGKVLRGRSNYGENDPLPMVAINEDPRTLEQIAAPQQSTDTTGDWNLLIQGFVQDDPTHPTDPAHVLMADCRAKLIEARLDKRNILGFGYKVNSVQDISVGAGVVMPPDNFSEKPYFWIPVRLTLVEDLANPFT